MRANEAPQRFDPFSISIALAALIVSATKAAWDMYHDVKHDRQEKDDKQAAPSREVMERRLRIELQPEGKVTAAQRDRIIAVVVDEVTKGSPEA